MMPRTVFLPWIAWAMAAFGTTIHFEEFGLPINSALPYTGGFSSGGAQFANSWAVWGSFTSWNGFAVSTWTDTTTPGYNNQFSAISGSGVGGSHHYAVGYGTGSGASAEMRITFPTDVQLQGLYVNNTTYAYLSMRDGDAFAKKFGGSSGNDPDWFLLTIRGWDVSDLPTGAVQFYLADYRFSDPAQDYIVDMWTWVDLSSLGASVRKLTFELDSSDVGPWGMNTPAYVALDNITVVPEPWTGATVWIAVGLAWLMRRRWFALGGSAEQK